VLESDTDWNAGSMGRLTIAKQGRARMQETRLIMPEYVEEKYNF
jgi:hypothetical protein